MPVALTVDIGWPWWVVTALAAGVVVACLGVLIWSRAAAVRAVAGLVAVEGVAVAILAPFVMSDMDASDSTGTSMSKAGSIVDVIERAPAQDMRMIGAVLTFTNPIYDSRNVRRIGRDQGFCVHIALAKGDECTWTTFLPTGQISAEGPLSDTETTHVAVIGGTGRYVGAQGWAEEKAHNKAGTEFELIFHLSD
jgi:hypothetical protein